jgi:cytochrome b subunit of formate dehydrogenase
MPRIGVLLALATLPLLAPEAAAQVDDRVCLLCHDDVQPADGDDRPRAHRDLSCVECHLSLWDSTVAEEGEHELDLAPVSCKLCHADQVKELRGGVHSARSDADTRPYPDCTSCHGTEHFQVLLEARDPSERASAVSSACATCHERDLDSFHASAHGQLMKDGAPGAPACTDCHETHEVRKPGDPASDVHTDNVSARCETCHVDGRASLHRHPGEPPASVSCTLCHFGHSTDLAMLRDRVSTEGGANKCFFCHGGQHSGKDLAHNYLQDPRAAALEYHCTTCHVFHWSVEGETVAPIRPQSDCGHCHEDQLEAYSRSAHARSREAGNLEPPTCVTCHGESDVQRADVHFDAVGVVQVCSSCHADYELMLSFEVNPHVVEGFEETYHGKLYDLLNTEKHFAVCTNCHGYHDVLEPEDPDSSVNRSRIVETCRECHEEATENFISYLVHPIQPTGEEFSLGRELRGEHGTLQPRSGVELDGRTRLPPQNGYATVFRVASWLMKALFAGVMSFFLLHTLLWFHRGARQRTSRKHYRRFTGYERMLHVMVNVSFLTLAFTGLPQTFSHTAMGRWILEHVLSLEAAQQLHYWAAAVTALYFVLHLLQVARNWSRLGWRRILTGPDSLVPRRKDWDDFVQHVRWFAGKGEKPRFDRWTYWEKFDYMAVFWGVAVIGLSGLIRWREEFFGNLFGGGLVSVATAVHEEEALLATAFIFVVHFFNTHLRREKFPMDMSIYTGTVSEREFEEERPLQYERLARAGTLAQAEVPARPAYVVGLAYLWGTLALLVGLGLLVLIVVGLVSGGL